MVPRVPSRLRYAIGLLELQKFSSFKLLQLSIGWLNTRKL